MRSLRICLAFALAPLQAQMPEVRTTAADRTALSVTVYQNGLAAVRDTRRVNLPAGPSRLAFADLLPSLRPKSALLLDPSHTLQVQERAFTFNLLSPASLLDGSLGAPVRIKGGQGVEAEAGVLTSLPLRNPPLRKEAKPLERIARLPSAFVQAPDSTVVVHTAEGFQGMSPETLQFRHLPPELAATPTLTQSLVAPSAGAQELTLLYTATGLTWEAHYTALVSDDGAHLELEAFATVTSTDAASLPGATLQLVAGDPHVIPDPAPRDPNQPSLDTTTVEVMATAMAGPPTFKEETLSEYPLFTLDRPVAIQGLAKKQLHLLSAQGIPLRTSWLVLCPYEDYAGTSRDLPDQPTFQPKPSASGFSPLPTFSIPEADHEPMSPAAQAKLEQEWHLRDWQRRHHPQVIRMASFANDRASRLGRALPKGSLSLRYQGPSGLALLLPGNLQDDLTFPQCPVGDTVELPLGPDCCLHATRRGWVRKQLVAPDATQGDGTRVAQSRSLCEVEVLLTNDGNQPTSVTLREPLASDATLKRASHPGHRSGGQSWDFDVRVPAHGRARLRYLVLTAPRPAESP